MSYAADIGVVIIGRNEGARLLACLDAIGAAAGQVVYVDSGSIDGSVEAAKAAGADVVLLDQDRPFTAARARNAGFERLLELAPELAYVQFIDGDCALREGWLAAAQAFLDAHADVAVVCGRRRERFPEASIYNRMIDAEWDTPVGEARACGGDALMRVAALKPVGGFDPLLIAGEEPELCVRLRQAGHRVWRLDAEMTWHDAALSRVSQWWKRCRRAGYAFAQGAAMHGAPPERHCVAETRRALLWGAGLPLVIVLGLFFTPWALCLAGLWGVKALRLWAKGYPAREAVFLTLGNLPEARGALEFYWKRWRGGPAKLIEYK